jgi:hypothetical protein
MSARLKRLLTMAAVIVATACAPPAADHDRVIILVVDGLRPDYVTAELMPRLNAMAETGFRGLAHHAVFPTVTRVNGPSIFTGRYPSGHGLMGNSLYLEEVDSARVLDASVRADLEEIDRATSGSLLTARSLGEILDAQGLTFFAASSGSTGSGFLMNHTGAGAGLVHNQYALPPPLEATVEEVLGPPPAIPAGASSGPLVARAIDAVLKIGIDRADADVLAAWLTEPDGTAHATGIGSPETVAVLGEVDNEIGRLLDGLSERGLLERTDILVTADHGFTTEIGATPLHTLLVDAGLKESAQSLDVVVAGSAITVRSGGAERVGAIVRLLQETDWIGPVFTRGEDPESGLGASPGTVAFSAIGWDHPRSADILTSPDWTDAENDFGYRGAVLGPGVAGHGSSSPYDVHATLVAAGPGIKRGVESSVPTGNIDLMPTALALIGATVPDGLDGRVISEALASGPMPSEVTVEPRDVTTATDVPGWHYELTAHRSRVESTIYFDGTEVMRTER